MLRGFSSYPEVVSEADAAYTPTGIARSGPRSLAVRHDTGISPYRRLRVLAESG